MITENDFVRVDITKEELFLAAKYAKEAEMGGASRVRDAQDRMNSLSIDQFIGVGLGELAGNKHFFSVEHYIESRKDKNENPHSGDKGVDTLGYRIDYKASRAWNAGLIKHNLLVRPHERHNNQIYVLILIWTYGLTSVKVILDSARLPIVYLIGWATDDMLPPMPESDGCFKGAYRLSAEELRPIRELQVDLIPKCDLTLA